MLTAPVEVADLVPVMLWMADAQGLVTYVNPASCAFAGEPASALLGDGWLRLLEPADRGAGAAAYRAAIGRGQPFALELSVRRADGARRRVRAQGAPRPDLDGARPGWAGAWLDVTEQQHEGAEALRELLLPAIFESLASHVVVLDRGGRITYASKPWERFAGDDGVGAAPVAVGTDYLALCRARAAAGDAVARATLDGIEAVMGGQLREFEIEYACPGSGPPRWLLMHVDAMPAGHGGVVVTHTDITARKTAEIELAEQKARYQSIFEGAGVALWEADFSAVKALVDDLAGRVKGDLRSHLAAHPEVVRHALSLVRLRSANRLALRTYGAASAEDAMRHFLDHATPEVEDTFATQMAAIARGRTYMEAETVVRTREGDFRHVIYTAAFPAAGDRFDRVLFSVLDVTERHRAEAALRASEERYRNVVESQTDLLCRYRPDATLTFVNDAYCRYFGRRRADLIGIRFTDLVPEESRPAVAAQVAALAREPHGTTTEHEVIRPDGTIGWQQWTAQPVVALDGVVLEIQAVGRDVTERRRAEEALRASQHALRTSHDRIQLLAGKLLTAQEEERRRISRELHDDLNQKLAALAIGLSNLRRRLPPDDGRLRHDVTALHGQAKALAADIRGLSHDLHPAVLEHAGLRAALQAHCAEFTGASGVTVALDVTDGAADLPPDVALCLYRVAQESLRNIARHSGAREARITLRTDREAVHLSVEDTGRGFDPDAPRARAGLGLVSMRERVRLLQGALEIQSRPGRTALLVQLPLRRPAS